MSARIIDAAVRTGAIVGLAIAAVVAFPGMARAQRVDVDDSQALNYSRGQGVVALYEGWHPNPDGTIDLWFGYLNQNWREEVDVPVGPDNSVTGPFVPKPPDGGQPTHFLPRNNRWQFAVRIPNAASLEKQEVVWTLTAHGRTYKAYATLLTQYVRDDEGIQREFYNEVPMSGNEPPKVSIRGETTRTIKAGQPSELVVMATDDGKPRVGGSRGPAVGGTNNNGRNRAAGAGRGNVCGQATELFYCGAPSAGGAQLFQIRGFRMGCFLYRGDPTAEVSSREDVGQASLVAFDPPQEKMWEDTRGGSSFAPGYALPPLPKDNTWHINTSFSKPGTYVVRCQAHDGLIATNQDVTFRVLE